MRHDGVFTPEEERRILAAAALGAREALRYREHGMELGQEASLGGRLPLAVRTLSLAVATTHELGGPFRSIQVLDCPPGDVTLRLFGYDNGVGGSLDVPAMPGLVIEDLPVMRAQLVVGEALEGSARILCSSMPRAFGAQRTEEWTPIVLRATGVGNAGPAITLAAGFDWELLCASLLVQNDATVANRVPHLAVFPPDAVAGDAPMGVAWVDANLVASTQGLLLATFGDQGMRFNDTGVTAIRPAAAATIEQFGQTPLPRWIGRIASAAASPNLEVSVNNGQAGDTVALTVMANRRRIR